MGGGFSFRMIMWYRTALRLPQCLEVWHQDPSTYIYSDSPISDVARNKSKLPASLFSAPSLCTLSSILPQNIADKISNYEEILLLPSSHYMEGSSGHSIFVAAYLHPDLWCCLS